MQAALGEQARWADTTFSERQKHEMNVPDKEGFFPLHYAVQYQRVDITKALLEAKCGKFTIIALWDWI